MANLVLIRHAPVKVDPDRPVTEWTLSQAGIETARALATRPAISAVRRFFCSPEPKAVATAEILAAGRPVEDIELLQELDRSGVGWVGDEARYTAMIEQVLRHPAEPVPGCETAVEAQRRVMLAVQGLIDAYPGGDLGVVSGGILLTLYLAGLQHQHPDPALWQQIRFPDYAVVNPRTAEIVQAFGSDPDF